MSKGRVDDPSRRRIFMAQRLTYTLLAIMLFIYGLITIRNFLYPIAFGFLLAYLLYPLVNVLENKGFPRILANLVTIFGAIIILGGLILTAYSILSPFSGELPHLVDTGIANFSRMVAIAGEYFGFDAEQTTAFVRGEVAAFIQSGTRHIQAFFEATTSTLVMLGLLPVYIFMFLYYRTKFMYFLMKVAGRPYRAEMIAILREISTVMVRYMAGVLLVVFILSIINSLGIYLIGVKYAIPLGITSAFFNFIPYFGTLLGGMVPFLFALLVEGDMVLTLRVVVLFIGIQFLENNILTPNIVGGNVKINPFFIITGLIAASMIWGVPGMLLIVPFLATIRIVFSHISFMRPYAFLLGEEGTARHSITMDKIRRTTRKAYKWFRRR